MERDTIAAAVADVDTAHHTPDTEFSLRLIAAAAPAKNHPESTVSTSLNLFTRCCSDSKNYHCKIPSELRYNTDIGLKSISYITTIIIVSPQKK